LLAAHLQGRQPRRALVRQALREPEAVDAVDPIEGRRHLASLVALQRPDQMPLDRAAQVGQRLDLGNALLHIVLAERALAGRMGLAHRSTVERLAHGKQRDALHGTLRCGTGRGNALAHLL
jgi:hypothetical protein